MRILTCSRWAAALAALVAGIAYASDGGASVYPAGVETILPGLTPPPGQTLLLEFNNFYQANELTDGNGRSAIPGFHLRVAAMAVKVAHNWGVNALGGTLVSFVALPVLYEHLTGPFGSLHKSGIGNPNIGVLDVAYAKGPWHWWYGLDVYTPGAPYEKNSILNVGQHNFAAAPDGAITFLPHAGRTEFSSKFQYIMNFTNPATQYRSGRQFVWEYAAMRNLTRRLSVGVNGYDYLQTSDDRQSGVLVTGGNRGRAFAAGPEIKYHLGEVALILKYQKEMLVENRPCGNSIWLQLGIPLWKAEK